LKPDTALSVSKIVKAVTDSGSNFQKAFKEYRCLLQIDMGDEDDENL